MHWSQRAYAWFLLAATFVLGVFAGLLLASSWDVERHVRETQRLIDQMPRRPSMHERFDRLEQRLQGIEERLPPSP
jgi:hypothetical protein